MRLDHCLDPDERLDVRGESVGHEVELPVWGDEGDRAVVLESCQPHTPSRQNVKRVKSNEHTEKTIKGGKELKYQLMHAVCVKYETRANP